jgi:hypothetical protein
MGISHFSGDFTTSKFARNFSKNMNISKALKRDQKSGKKNPKKPSVEERKKNPEKQRSDIRKKRKQKEELQASSEL